MSVQIVDEAVNEQNLVDFSVIIATIEKNRDRIRTLGGMLISTTGILFSANLAFISFFVDKVASVSISLVILFFLALALLLITLLVSISASFLRQDFSIKQNYFCKKEVVAPRSSQ